MTYPPLPVDLTGVSSYQVDTDDALDERLLKVHVGPWWPIAGFVALFLSPVLTRVGL